MIDLHTHSRCSDGTLAPRDLVALAAAGGVSALALTDHDTVAGIDEAKAAAALYGVRFLAGVEIEADFSPGRLHVLGLGLRDWHGAVEERLVLLRNRRTERNFKIVEKMKRAGIPVTIEDVEKIAVGTVVGRPHFAEFLRRQGLVKSIQEAFDRYLASGKRFYARRENLPVGDAVDLIRLAGGRAVVAHPLTLRVGMGELRELLSEWKKLGMEGVEAFHSNAPRETADALARLAAELGLFVTAGSDFHGDYRPDRHLGRGADGRPIGDEYLAAFDGR